MPNWKKVIISGSDATLNSLNTTTSLTASGLIYPDTDGDNGDFLSTDGAGNLTFQRSTIYANVKNVSGGTLQKGTPIHATGTAGNASEVIASSASVASTMPATYVLNETLADDAEGLAIITGYINGVNTSLFGEGDVVYVGESGGFTNVKPTGSDNLIQNLGVVNKVDASNGSGYVYGSGRSNDVPNILQGYAWIGNADGVATPTATSSIQNVVSSSYAVTASHALNAGGSTALAFSYFNVQNSSLADRTTYRLGQMTGLQTSVNAVAHIPLPAGTITEAYIGVYNAGTFASGEDISVIFVSDGGSTTNILSSAVTADSRHQEFIIEGLSISINAGRTFVNIETPTFTTNPTAVQFRVAIKLEL
jgi:hypothetical protein